MRSHIIGAALVAGVAVAGFTLGAPALAWEGITNGRMTGGGNFMCTGLGGAKVTYGFEVHCGEVLPNNFEINWDGGNHFHLDTLTNAQCIDNPSFSPNPPPAPFDTYYGTGTGTYNGVPGATIYFNLTDQGEPGTSDTISVTILDASGNVVLDCNTVALSGGNNQAHLETP